MRARRLVAPLEPERRLPGPRGLTVFHRRRAFAVIAHRA